jgi:aminoglycoside 3-N-acetyltransferase
MPGLFRHHTPIAQVSQADLENGLRALGLPTGSSVIVHTAMSAFGHLLGGAPAVVDAVRAVLGPEGTLVVPTMTWFSSYLRSPAWPPPLSVEAYDPALTPPDRNMGQVPWEVWRRPIARRSAHPLMSITAIGPRAAALAGDHPMSDPLRPYRRLAESGGWVLLQGVDHTRNTTIHAAEFMLDLPHLSGPAYALVADRTTATGSRILTMPREPDCSEGFNRLADRIPRREIQVGHALLWLCRGQDVLDTALAALQADRTALLCDRPRCRTCTRGRRMYRQ